MDYDTIFNTSGKIPTDSEFWHKDIDFGDERTGITKFFSKVLGEQVYHPVKSPVIKFYAQFAGRPLPAGFAWEERIMKKTIAKHFNPKASASDDLQFYDNSGYSWKFGLNVEGWKPVTLPSNLASLEDNLKPENVGTFNGILVDQVMKDYQRDMESAIGKKLISTASNDKTITYGSASDLIAAINDIVTEMKGTKVHYNDVTTDPDGETINDNIYTNSEKVLIFMDEKLSNWIKAQMGSLPSPDKVAIEGAEIITLVDGLPTPITAEEFTAGVSAQGWDADEEPAAMGEAQPDIFICSAARCEYRPLVDSYRVNLSKNGAGDFVNQHLIWKGAIAIRPWENALRVYLSYDESGTPVTITNTEDNPVPTQEVSPRVDHSITYTVQPDGSGNLSGLSSAMSGTVVHVEAIATSGYQISEITVETASGDPIEISATNNFVMPDEDVTVTGIFTTSGHTITVLFDPADSGMTDIPAAANTGQRIEFILTGKTGYYPINLTSDDVEVMFDRYFVMPDADITVTAHFSTTPKGTVTTFVSTPPVYDEEFIAAANVTVPSEAEIGTTIEVTCDEQVNYDGAHYTFQYWNVQGEAERIPTNDASLYIPLVFEDEEEVEITAAYKQSYPIMLAVDPVQPTPSFFDYTTLGQVWNIRAQEIIPTGYHFVKWECPIPGIIEDLYLPVTRAHIPEEPPESGVFSITLVLEAD